MSTQQSAGLDVCSLLMCVRQIEAHAAEERRLIHLKNIYYSATYA